MNDNVLISREDVRRLLILFDDYVYVCNDAAWQYGPTDGIESTRHYQDLMEVKSRLEEAMEGSDGQ